MHLHTGNYSAYIFQCTAIFAWTMHVNTSQWRQACTTFFLALKGSYDVAKKNIILCIWCNAMCLCGLSFKKHIIFHILYIIVAPLCSAFLKRVDFYQAHCSEKRGVLWFASYPVRCDWPNTSSVSRNVAPLTVLWCRLPVRRHKNNKTHYKRGICCIQWGHNYWL